MIYHKDPALKFSSRDKAVVRWAFSIVIILMALMVGISYLLKNNWTGVIWMGALLVLGTTEYLLARNCIRCGCFHGA